MTLPPAPNHSLRPTLADICDEILRQVAQRGPDKSICPSEVARALLPEGKLPEGKLTEGKLTEGKLTEGVPVWQSLMGPVRHAAVTLAQQGRIDILRKGRPVSPPTEPAALKGVIRLRRR